MKIPHETLGTFPTDDVPFDQAMVVAGYPVKLNELVNYGDLADTETMIAFFPDLRERTTAVWAALHFPRGQRARRVDRAVYAEGLRIRTTLRLAAYGKALSRVVNGVGKDDRPRSFPSGLQEAAAAKLQALGRFAQQAGWVS